MSEGRRRPGTRGDARGRAGEGTVRFSDALGAVASRLGVGRADIVGTVFGGWEDLVGAPVAAHVRPLRIDGTTLVVAVDHPAWATQIRELAPDILRRVAEACGPTQAPERLEVRVRR